MIRVGIVGISGYSGELLLNILLKHPQVRITYVSAGTTKGKIEDIFPYLKGKTSLVCGEFDAKKAAASCDVVFLAVPHTASLKITPQLLAEKKRVIDLSADYRLTDTKIFEQWYHVAHSDKKNLAHAVYGLPELYREDIKNAQLIANPGCYPTTAILALAPIMAMKAKSVASVIIDAKSGTTGAGRKAAANLLFAEVNENFKAYKVLSHQHTPEIEQILSSLAKKDINLTFTAHLLPVSRGILETIYVQFKNKSALENLHGLYTKFYKTEPFVRVLTPGLQPELKFVNATNYCDIAIVVDEAKKLSIITSATDNLMKGASGQAVQNMNIMYGFDETAGLL
ncbi:MAG: N-acetyl-gamma-glutamyl-phosphate reductase [Candidatus Omnitrophota bacterium]